MACKNNSIPTNKKIIKMICYNLNHSKLSDILSHRSLIDNDYVCNFLQCSSLLDLRVLRASM